MASQTTATQQRRMLSIAAVENQYSKYLVRERGLSPASVHTYWWYVQSFLLRCGSAKKVDLRSIRRSDIDVHISATARRVSLRGVQTTTSALRSFLRFAFLTGLTQADLSAAVLPARSWRHAELPRYLPAADVARLLESCDCSTPQGRKDKAILFVMARLGLRPKEIQRIALDDFNWARGEVLVRGKGKLHDWMPLPHDVGSAIVAYLRDRPAKSARHVFITPKETGEKPYLTSAFVNHALHRALERCGISAPPRWVGAHLLRHSLATNMCVFRSHLNADSEGTRALAPKTLERSFRRT